MQTYIHKSSLGWKATTEFDLDDRKVLRIRTCKGNQGALLTHATVSIRDNHGSLTHAIDFGTGGGDFSRHVARSQPARVTEKVVQQQHDQVLAQLAEIKAAVMLHYAAKAETVAQAEAFA